VIVRAAPGAVESVARAVQRAGGAIGRKIGILDGIVADVPAASLDRVRRLEGVRAVSLNGRVHMLSMIDGFDAAADNGSMNNTAKIIGAPQVWRQGYTGRGIDVAMIDTGAVAVNGLTAAGKVVNGPDLSFESQAPSLQYLDTYGHGTHMAGIIAGRDDSVSSNYYNPDNFVGIAPDARVLSVKVADANGITDVSQVLAAIDWVVQHRTDNGMNVRVLNLSFGTDGGQSYVADPLAYATEVAWRRGIVVVVAAGNSGTSLGRLNDPAIDPYVIAVGANDPAGTSTTSDDSIPSWSSRGDGTRNPDLVAPGKSIVALRNPGSNIDVMHPEGKVNTRFFRGSGTSQAAAVVSGAAALLLQQHPNATPDMVKRALVGTASPVPGADATAQGAGTINVRAASNFSLGDNWRQTYPRSTGTGSLDAARGSAHIVKDGVTLTGEIDIFGRTWDGTSWSGTSWSGTSWSGGTWNGTSWSGTSWSGTSWSGTSWSGTSWSGTSWSGTSWSGTSWSGTSWSGTSWSGAGWNGTSWSGTSWSGTSWSGTSWSGTTWSGHWGDDDPAQADGASNIEA
jgi:serine protease AprX